jgi:hypothetical protein
VRVTKVQVSLRYSKELPAGAWKSVELGAEATLTEGETREGATAALYDSLVEDMKRMWNNRNPPSADPT